MLENPYSFLTHFYGMYRVAMPDLGQIIHFVIMKSVFNTEKEIHKIYDLKGSTAGRKAKRGDSVRKDLDILEEGWKVRVGGSVKKAMMEQLRHDTDFLVQLRIMDYSLLLGLHVHSSDS
jgi:1-phosphatidylinositol-4-phosphate 5-kinase